MWIKNTLSLSHTHTHTLTHPCTHSHTHTHTHTHIHVQSCINHNWYTVHAHTSLHPLGRPLIFSLIINILTADASDVVDASKDIFCPPGPMPGLVELFSRTSKLSSLYTLDIMAPSIWSPSLGAESPLDGGSDCARTASPGAGALSGV